MNSLRVKVEFVLFLTVGLVVALSFGIQRYGVLPSLNPLEEEFLKDMGRVIEVMRDRQAELTALGADRAADPGLSSFLRGENEEYGVANFSREALIRQRLNVLYLLDPDGQVLSGHAIDLSTEAPLNIDQFPIGVWDASNPFLNFNDARDPVAGALRTSLGLAALVSSHPISDDEGDVLGSLVVARLLDISFINSISAETSFGFNAWLVGDNNLRVAEREAYQAMQLTGQNTIPMPVPDSEETIRIYGLYQDYIGDDLILLRADLNRKVLAKAYSVLQRGLLYQVGIGLTALVLLIVLFRRTVMNPLSVLTRHATAIGKTNDLSARLRMERDDEIGILSCEFDRMVTTLEEDKAKQKASEEALRESEERYAVAVRGANDGLWDWNLLTNEIVYTARWKTMLGYEEDEIGSDPEEWFALIHPEDVENLRAALEPHIQGQSAHFESEHRIHHKGGNYLWVLCRGLAILDDKGKATRMAGSQSDITLRKLFEEQLSHQALHDSLTTLPNRILFLDRLNMALKHAKRDDSYVFAILFLDIDRFKVINDGLGHAIGDILLTSFAERMTAALRIGDTLTRSSGTIARFGGDEFVLLLDNVKEASGATLVAERIQNALKDPFKIEGNEIYTTVSIGIAVSDGGDLTPEEFVRNADTAMYRAKAAGKARFEMFDADMHSKAMARIELENEMHSAIERNEFIPYFQPIVTLKTGKIEAFEALMRWVHPEKGLIPPTRFIPIAEATGMIVAMGKSIMRAACRQTRAWQIKIPHAANLRASVNLSVKEFSKPALVNSISGILEETGLEPRCMKIEITESAIMESIEFVTKTLKALREMSIELSIDDFGTGYSSLSYLHRFPMNTLKIDQAFVREMHIAPENLQIIKTIITLAHALDMTVIAEGIEDETQLNILRELGCEYGQGFLFSKPLAPAEAEVLLASDPTW